MVEFFSGRCSCGFTVDKVHDGRQDFPGARRIGFCMAHCYGCQLLFDFKYDLPERRGIGEGTGIKSPPCPKCARPAEIARLLEFRDLSFDAGGYDRKNRGMRHRFLQRMGELIGQLFGKKMRRSFRARFVREPSYLTHCPRCGTLRLRLFSDGHFDP